MARTPWFVYLWPGLPPLWKRGSWSGLTVAVGFAILLNLALVSTLVWTELEPLAAAGRTYIWVVVLVFWVGSAAWSFHAQRREARNEVNASGDESYGEALDHYLQQNWYEAQRCLGKLLRRNPRDLDARLMLAMVLRHTGRLSEAAGQLDRLSRLEGSQKWEFEIEQQRQWLAAAAGRANEEEAATDDSPADEKVAA